MRRAFSRALVRQGDCEFGPPPCGQENSSSFGREEGGYVQIVVGGERSHTGWSGTPAGRVRI